MDFRLLAILVFSVLACSDVEGFCGPRVLRTGLARAAVRAGEWLRNQQDANGTYGEGHTSAFVFHSLRLIGHSVEGGASHLNDEINRKGLDSISGGRIARYVHGALATCRDPEQFYDHNLISVLRSKLKNYPVLGFNHPFQYALAVLAMCSSGSHIEETALKDYVSTIKARLQAQSTVPGNGGVDTFALEVMALTCIQKSNNGKGKPQILSDAKTAIDIASGELLKRHKNDSTFRQNEVSAGLAAQALVASRASNEWNCSATMAWLKSRQNPDGSFINFFATFSVLPSLIGALPYEVREVTCHKESSEEIQMIEVCLELQFDVSNHTVGKTPPQPLCFSVLNGTNTHDIMKLAANQNPCYNFTTVSYSWGHSVYSICGISRVAAEKYYWMIYIAPGKYAPVGIDSLKPKHGTTVIFKFEKLHWRK